MKKSELEELMIENIQKANKELIEQEYWDQSFEKNLQRLGNSNPNVVHLTYQATTLKIMATALVNTLIDLKIVDVED